MLPVVAFSWLGRRDLGPGACWLASLKAGEQSANGKAEQRECVLELRVLGSSACPRYTLAAAAFQQNAKCHRAHKELEVISAPSGILGPQPRGFCVPWRSTDCQGVMPGCHSPLM